MSLKDRVAHIRHDMRVSMSAYTLRSYYLKHKISFKTVDLHVVKKAQMKNLIS